MAKVGSWGSDSNKRDYCTMTLDDGDKVVVNHDKGSSKTGWLTVERLKMFGFSSDRVFVIALDSPAGRTALAFLTRDAQERSGDVTPLRAFVEYLRTSSSVADIKGRCGALLAMHKVGGGPRDHGPA